MADLLTHACVGLLVSRASDRVLWTGALAGSLLPDVFARVPPLALGRFVAPHVDLPPHLALMFMPLHLPVGMVLSSAALALLFVPRQRAAMFWSLLLGMGLHIAVDLLQDHLDVGYALLFPCSLVDFELPLMGSEDSIFALPVLFPLTVFVFWRLRKPTR